MALIDVYNPAFWAQETLMQLYPQLKMAGLVYRDFNSQIAAKGDTVNTRMPGTLAARDANPDSFASNKPTAVNVQVKLDQWKEVVFEVGDKEASLSIKDLIAEYMTPAAHGIAEAVEDAMTGLYKDIANNIGTAGTTPATVSTLGTDIKEKFDTLQIPDDSRQVVLGPAAVNKFNQVFYQDFISGSTEQQTTGALRPKFGMQYTDSNKLPKHLTALSGAPLGVGPQAAAITSLSVDGLTGAVKKGDLFSLVHPIAGVTTYVVTADAAIIATAASIPIYPPLLEAVLDNCVLTPIAPHSVNLAFHKQAFALVSRPLNTPNAPGANVYVADFAGLGLRSSLWYEPKDLRTYCRLDLLFGVKTLDARKAMRVMG